METNINWYYVLPLADGLFLIGLWFGDRPGFWRGLGDLIGWIFRGFRRRAPADTSLFPGQSSIVESYGMPIRNSMYHQSPAPFDFITLMENREHMTHNAIADWQSQYYYLKNENVRLRGWNAQNTWRIAIKFISVVLLFLHLYAWQSERYQPAMTSPVQPSTEIKAIQAKIINYVPSPGIGK